MLEGRDDYWAMVPNGERFRYMLSGAQASENLKIATVSADTPLWERIFECEGLAELTLHLPSKEQIAALPKLKRLERLRITKIQVKNIDFLARLPLLRELVLEYVSGFCDLSPLRELKSLKSAHFENLRRVSDFSGLSGIASLRYLGINGTLDWDQPLKNLKKINIYPQAFALEEYALVQLVCEGVEGAKMPLTTEFKDTGYVKFLGRGSGYTKIGAKNEVQKRAEFEQKFKACKQKAREVLGLDR